MKPNELRIGNFIMFAYIKKVFNVDLWLFAELKNGISKIDELEPITITEEWLIRFGFEEDGPDWFFRNCKDRFTDIGYSYNIKTNVFEFEEILVKQINYIHQLQNLYFALSGEELELKEKDI